MTGEHLLWLAERLCGAAARRSVLEPLVADWQREVHDAPTRARQMQAQVRGALAFITTFVICANPFRENEGQSARHFLVAVLGFALVETILQSGPFQAFTWRRFPLRWEVVLSAPRFFAVGIALAMLPAAMLVAQRIRLTRFVIAASMTLALAFVARDIVAPRSYKILQDLRRAEFVAPLPPSRQQEWIESQRESELRELAARQRDETGAWAHISRIERHEDWAFALMVVAFGLLGLAIGRARDITPRITTAAGWWFFVWMAYQALQFLANRLRIVLPTPIEVAIWLPPVAVLTVAIVAVQLARRENPRESIRVIRAIDPRN